MKLPQPLNHREIAKLDHFWDWRYRHTVRNALYWRDRALKVRHQPFLKELREDYILFARQAAADARAALAEMVRSVR